MKTLRLFGILFLATLFNLNVKAQDLEPMEIEGTHYNTAIGLRAGETSGLTIKHFTSESIALEGIIGFWNRGFSGTLLVERYQQAFGVPRLHWYYGIGGHVSVAMDHYVWYRNGRRYVVYEDDHIGGGVDLIGGIEYKIPRTPLACSFDLKPYLEVVSNGNVWMSVDPGIGIKLTF